MPETASTCPLTLTIDDLGASAIIHCHGKLVYGCTDALYLPVSQLIPTHKHIALDLQHLTHMDSMGVGILIRLYVAAKTRGCVLELRNLGDRIRQLLIMTNLLPVFATVGEHHLRM